MRRNAAVTKIIEAAAEAQAAKHIIEYTALQTAQTKYQSQPPVLCLCSSNANDRAKPLDLSS